MHMLAPLLFLALLQALGVHQVGVTGVVPARPAGNACELARQISSMEPCLEPATCRSLDAFRRHFGDPGVRWLVPESEKGPPGGGSGPFFLRSICLAGDRP